MSRYALCGKLVSIEGKRAALIAVMQRAAAQVEKAGGCELYLVFEDQDDANALWITELWASKEAHERSLKDPAVRSIIGEARPCLDFARMTQARLTPLFGVGMPGA